MTCNMVPEKMTDSASSENTKSPNKPTNQLNHSDPIAIVGIGCRFPKDIDSPDSLFEALLNGHDGVSEVPKDRFNIDHYYDPDPNVAGKVNTRKGAFLEDWDKFDPEFFGYFPNVANKIDPQQRLTLMMTYEAMEDAGVTMEELSGKRVAVYMGEFMHDNYSSRTESASFRDIGPNTAMVLPSFTAGRVSDRFNFRGPAICLDTACSSSLVATKLGLQSIWSGEADYAFVGGVNIMSNPASYLMLSKGGFLSPDGRCKSFDASANGYVRGETCGVVLLMPLSQAERRGFDIYAVIKGAAVNHDGFTKEGITVPSKSAQVEMLHQAYSNAGIDPMEVDYIEAHGTGTSVGDPVETSVLGRVFAEGRCDNNPLLIGSIKSNIGHTEGGSGIAGLIKLALAIKRKTIPKNIHFNNPNPNIKWNDWKLKVVDENCKWTDSGNRPIRGGVNSFGASGTNVHVILEEYIPSVSANADDRANECSFDFPMVFNLSAKSVVALKDLAKRYVEFTETSEHTLVDICSSVAKCRSNMETQLAIISHTKDELTHGLQAYINNESFEGLITGTKQEQPLKVAFVCSGQGPQWYAMGRQLMETSVVFRRTVEEIDRIFKKLSGFSLLEQMLKSTHNNRINETRIAQPAIMAMQIGLIRIWKEFGVEAEGLVGHSVGEVAAAYGAGALTLEQAVEVIYKRSREQDRASGSGGMLAVGLSLAKARRMISGLEEFVSVAAINSPGMLVLSGDFDPLQDIANRLKEEEIFHKFLQVNVPFHSHHMEPLKENLLASLKNLNPKEAKVPLYSTVTGNQEDGTHLVPEYWYKNVRDSVLFTDALKEMINDGYNVFVEIAPHPILSRDISDVLLSTKKKGYIISSARRDIQKFESGIRYEESTFLNGATKLSQLGIKVSWDTLFQGKGAKRIVKLPRYAWQLSTLTCEESEDAHQKRKGNASAHPILTKAHLAPDGSYNAFFDIDFDRREKRWLNDHVVDGVLVVPATAHVEAAYQAAKLTYGDKFSHLDDIYFDSALMLPEEEDKLLDVKIQIISDKGDYRLFSRLRGEHSTAWSEHSGGTMNSLDHIDQPHTVVDIEALKKQIHKEVDILPFYADLRKDGLAYGKDFRLIKSMWKNENEVLAKVELNDKLAHHSGVYSIHPVMMDAMLHSTFALTKKYNGKKGIYLPSHIGRIQIFAKPEPSLFAHVQMHHHDDKLMVVDVTMINLDGVIVGTVEKLSAKYVEGSRRESTSTSARKHHVYEWKVVDCKVLEEANKLPKVGDVDKIVAFGDNGGVIGQAMALIGPQANVIDVMKCKAYTKRSNSCFGLNPNCREDFNRLILAASEGSVLKKVVFGWALDYSFDGTCPSKVIDKQTTEMANAGMNLVKALIEFDYKGEIYFVTNGVNRVSNETNINFGQGVLVGIHRVLVNEHHNMEVRAIDLSHDKMEVGALAEEVLHYGSALKHREVALRGKKRYNHVICEWDAKKAAEYTCKRVEVGDKPFRYDLIQNGLMDTVIFRDHKIMSISDRDVVVEVKSAGLNLTDILNYTETKKFKTVKAGATENRLGLEVAGVVLRVGSAVTDFKKGDEVFGLVPYGIASTILTQDHLLQLKPSHLSFPEAASIAFSFETAYYCLVHLASVEEGERVLIHSAAGGIGLAAIQVANLAGAEIYATVDSKEKVKYLKEFGIKHIYSSDSSDFYSNIMQDTNGKGIDIVLNPPSGECSMQSLRALCPFGRFLDIRTPDHHKTSCTNFKEFGENISYHVVDICRLNTQKPKLSARLMKEVADLFALKKLKPLPIKVYDVAKTEEAIRYLEKGAYIGKVVIYMKGKLDLLPAKQLTFSNDATYVITGGASGLGLQYAKFLADRGAKNLVLISRSGIKKSKDQVIVDTLIAMGVNVSMPKVDILDEPCLNNLITEVNHSMPPIKGIIHSAAILDDLTLSNMSIQRWRKVYLPKVIGAWNLHNATLNSKIDFFLNISSVSAFVGLPGQSSYAAANCTLDRFSMYRQAQGLAGCSIDLGLLGEYAGMSEINEQSRWILENLNRQGIEAMDLDTVLDRTEKVILEQKDYCLECDIDWVKFGDYFKHLQKDSRFELVLEKVSQGQDSTAQGGNTIIDQLMNSPKEERQKFLQKSLQNILVKLFGTTDEKVPITRPLSRMGLDSLMMNQFHSWIQNNLEINFPLMQIVKGPSIAELSSELLTTMLQNGENNAVNRLSKDLGIGSDIDITVFANNWLVRNRKGPAKPRVRIFLQHSLGGSASMFAEFLANPHDDIDFVAIQWPGREHRRKEAPIKNMETMVNELTEVIEPFTDIPFVFWGHSLGGLVMYCVAASLKKKGLIPLQFIATSTIAPHRAQNWQKNKLLQKNLMDDLQEKSANFVWDYVMSMLDSLDNTTPGHKEMMVPIFKRMEMDFPVMKSYRFCESSVLECPLVVYSSPDDELVTVDEVDQWSEHTSKEFTHVQLMGDHWFISRPEARKIIQNNLMGFLSSFLKSSSNVV